MNGTAAEKQLHLERAKIIGGSDVGALWSLDWGCRRELDYEKSGTTPDFPEISRPEFERGKYIESVVAQMYADKTKRQVTTTPLVHHKSIEGFGVHMDRIVNAPEREEPGYLEIKVVNRRTMKKFKIDGLHGSYVLQMQGGLSVTGMQWGSFAVLCLDPWEFLWFDVERDEEIIQRIETEVVQFWKDMKNDPKPELARLPLGDKRCFTCQYRRTCRGTELDALTPQGEGAEDLIDRPDLLPLAAEAHEISVMQDDLDAMLKEINAQMLAAIGTSYGVSYPGGRSLRIAPKGSKKWDSKALWALWEKATPRLKEMLGPYCNNGKEGRPPAPFVRHYWTGGN
jgi:hypothetical protein